MPKGWTKTAAFAQFGATLVNTRWSWSARTPDRAVVLALWRDRFDESAAPVMYHERTDALPPLEWVNRPGNRDRREHLASIGIGGSFRVVMATAKDRGADPREGTDWCPRGDLSMRITYIKSTGQFGAELIGGTL